MNDRLPPTAMRPLTHGDLERWLALQAYIADPYDMSSLREELNLRQSRTLCFAEAGQLLGALLAWLVVDELQIMQVIVVPDARRRGVARAMVQQVVRRSRAAGAVTEILEVRAGNEAAIELYRSMGFAVDGQRTGYYPDGEDALLMRRDLGRPDGRSDRR